MTDVEAEFARRVSRAARAGPLMGSHARERIVRGVLEAAGLRQLLERVAIFEDAMRKVAAVAVSRSGYDDLSDIAGAALDGQDATDRPDPATCLHADRARVGPVDEGRWACNDCGYDNGRWRAGDDPVQP